MNLRSILSLPLTLSALLDSHLHAISPRFTRSATTMTLDSAKMSVLHAPLQPHTKAGDSTHPTGFMRDGFCWGNSGSDSGRHFIGGVVTQEFLEFSKERGNDLMTRRGGFPGLTGGCRWCLCVERWKEALAASERLGDKVVPRVDLSATALDALKSVKLEELKRFEYKA
ncbi:hypothetical protein IAR55_006344 [Kwoniella newhampshirensis]|uniref:Uncharacterized protein n=1 Tax=Kwoniella newhampshirensis TaxID=1651941 RepID=A0AAW0YY38_9TREE